MKIIVGSKNKHKVNAVIQVAKELDIAYEVEGFETESGVSEKPRGDDETLSGAMNRATHARQAHPEAIYTIGLESGFNTVLDETYVTNWCTITNKNGTRINVAGIAFLKPEVSGPSGFIGVVSNDGLTRQDIIASLVRDAFILIRSKEHDEN